MAAAPVMVAGTLLWADHFLLVAAVTGIGVLAFYGARLPGLLSGLQPSPERMSLRENCAARARSSSPELLWLLAVCSLAFVVVSVLVVIVNATQWLGASAGVLFFGFCAGIFVFMLVLKRRT